MQSSVYVHDSQTVLLLIVEAEGSSARCLAQHRGAVWGRHAAEGLAALREVAQTSLTPFLPERGTQSEILSNTHGARQVKGQRGAGRKKPCGQSEWRRGGACKTAKHKEKKTINSEAQGKDDD